MKASSLFALVVALGAALPAVSGCGGTGPAPMAASPNAPPIATPPPNQLYVDHLGTLYEYRLPLSADSKPERTLTEWPGLGLAPQIAVAPGGDVAVASSNAIRIFSPPIVSFEPSRAKLSITLTPAITEVGPSGAALIDIEYDPNGNLWLLNNLGAEISELRTPLTKSSIAAVTIALGAPGSKTAGFNFLVQARFDVNAALYVYASASTRSRLFKLSFPYAKQPSSVGINLAQADFVDSSQYLPTSQNPASVLLGQYIGELATPRPGSPPSPPADVMGQFDEPLNPVEGLVPNHIVKTVVGALTADAPRQRFYTLLASNGKLEVFGLPLPAGAKPSITLPCLGGNASCVEQSEHLFLAP
jgi:hypothetical protein